MFPTHKNYKQHFVSFAYASATCHGLKNQIFWDMMSHTLPIDKASCTRRCESSSTSFWTPPRCGICIDSMQLAKQHHVITLALTWSLTMNQQTMMKSMCFGKNCTVSYGGSVRSRHTVLCVNGQNLILKLKSKLFHQVNIDFYFPN